MMKAMRADLSHASHISELKGRGASVLWRLTEPSGFDRWLCEHPKPARDEIRVARKNQDRREISLWIWTPQSAALGEEWDIGIPHGAKTSLDHWMIL
jgi:hypothetical protein